MNTERRVLDKFIKKLLLLLLSSLLLLFVFSTLPSNAQDLLLALQLGVNPRGFGGTIWDDRDKTGVRWARQTPSLLGYHSGLDKSILNEN